LDARVYESFGGEEFFRALVHEFYIGIKSDEVLRPMYPEQDLQGAEDRLRWFLEQYWGGPDTYQQLRGHPRLRMRHFEFKINPLARDRWLFHMKNALDAQSLSPVDRELIWDYLERAAHAMLNTLKD
jgi:hemoglobin